MYSEQINLLDGEYWWGGIVHDGSNMPMGDSDFGRDLAKEQFGNQTAPFLVSNKGRYLWSSGPFSYNFKNRVLIIESSISDIVFSEGHQNMRNAYLDAARKYFPASGEIPDELMFTKPQFNCWIEMMYEPTGEKMIRYAETLIERDIPAGVIMIDDNWQDDYGVWDFHSGRFPKPNETIDRLHELGFKVMLWICNYVSPDSLTFRNLEQKGYLVKNTNGDTAIVHWWNGYSGMLDLTNPDAVKWFKGQLDHLVNEYGIDGFKFDAGDPEVYNDGFVTHKKVSGVEYCELWAKLGLDYKLNEYRACWKMQNQALAQRLCDKHHVWDRQRGVAALIPNGLMQGIIGYAYNCPDLIGGGDYLCFLDNPDLDEELVVRYAQCAALFPMMQFSVSPWRVLDAVNLGYCIDAAKLHCEFGAEILELAKHSAKTGEPIIRHMEYVFPGCGYEKIDDQFMLGDDVLVAPVVTPKTYVRKVVFPAGTWQGVNETVEGPCEKLCDSPIETLLWYRAI